MKLSEKAIKDFRNIFHKYYRVLLNEEDANKKGIELLEFMRLIYKPIPRKN